MYTQLLLLESEYLTEDRRSTKPRACINVEEFLRRESERLKLEGKPQNLKTTKWSSMYRRVKKEQVPSTHTDFLKVDLGVFLT